MIGWPILPDGGLTEAQRHEIDRRLANPRYADPAKVSEFFARYGIKAT